MNTNDYIDDVFTKVDDKINIDANNLNINCITSKNNKFSLDSDGNLVVNSITATQNLDVNINYAELFNLIYPIGSIYMSTTNINPSTLFGGTWEAIKDRFLLAAGDIYSNGTIGGEASHILSIEEMPSHNHGIYGRSIYASNGSADGVIWWNPGSGKKNVESTGGSKAHNNMPPYLTVYMYKRVS